LKNVILILIDDLGQKDIGIFLKNETGAYNTPSVDQLASMSVVFDNAYASYPLCGPSRVSLLTGRYPARFNIPENPFFDDQCLKRKYKTFGPDTETIGKAFKKHGYETTYIGKWGAGAYRDADPSLNTEGSTPWVHGFDTSIGVSLYRSC